MTTVSVIGFFSVCNAAVLNEEVVYSSEEMDSRPHEGIHSARPVYCLRRTFCRGSVFHSSQRCAVSVVAAASDLSYTPPLASATNNTSLHHRYVYTVPWLSSNIL